MKNTDFTTVITVNQLPSEVYEAINNVREWWHGKVEGITDQLHEEFNYRYEEFHESTQKIVELIPDSKVVWLVTKSKLNFISDKEEWTGTKIIFEIREHEGKTELHFTHQGLVPQFECYGDCSNGWSMLIHESLLGLITSGKGKEVFK